MLYRVKGAVFWDHLKAAGGVVLQVSAGRSKVQVAPHTKAVQRVGEKYPLILHLEDAPSEPGVVLIVLAPKQVPHPEHQVVRQKYILQLTQSCQ